MSKVDAARKPYRIALYGPGPDIESFRAFVHGPGMEEIFAEVQFAGAAPGDPGQASAGPDIPVYPSLAALLAARPDVNCILELTGNGLPPGTVLPPGVTVMDRLAAMLLKTTVSTAALCETCRLDLSKTKLYLDAVFDHLDDEVVLAGPSGLVEDVNRVARRRTGKPKEALLGRHCREVLDELQHFRPAAPDDISPWEALLSGKDGRAEYSRMDAEDRLRYFRVAAHTVGEPGRPAHTVIVRRDVTHDVFLERRLQKSERLAAIGELSMFISHEIRNPLFAIAGFANSLLRSSGIDEPSREKVGIILQESNRLDTILKSIINFARPTQATPGEVDLNHIVRQTMDLMRVGMDKQGVEMIVETASSLPKARGDTELLKQCLVNLLKNSMEAMPHGGRITVATGMRQGNVFLTVADTGQGIPKETLPQVFNPFFSTRDKGSGLGLAMTKKILDDLGGSVEIKSEVGRGTAVTLLLPPFFALDKDAPHAE
ncbi:two-component system sensor histidine kinase NtrB [Desulfolutivibrio sulfoxidireducens]|uniref:two-component system sensor histidine kinase NtrB n=1 Tax=Desulfolutivibrio sulfoxidireducens TaxID=2773299 RepID=UPI00159D07FB|nr:ATP-binding protein [Desulfolutivibrio sulfoxidireducens]QLA15079.1 PAS domain-containing protein [Desulfolutivibrio sulfoxidireducens]QLA18650.1 PAS domain-containing protein [Desulfolutivibrio sulfoxidireducens]